MSKKTRSPEKKEDDNEYISIEDFLKIEEEGKKDKQNIFKRIFGFIVN